jgi:hypothetical protein
MIDTISAPSRPSSESADARKPGAPRVSVCMSRFLWNSWVRQRAQTAFDPVVLARAISSLRISPAPSTDAVAGPVQQPTGRQYSTGNSSSDAATLSMTISP